MQLAPVVVGLVLGLAEQLRIAGSSVGQVCELQRERLLVEGQGMARARLGLQWLWPVDRGRVATADLST